MAMTAARIKQSLGAGDRGLLDGAAGKRRRVPRGSCAEEVGLRERAKSLVIIRQAKRDLKRLREFRKVTMRIQEEAIRARDCSSAVPPPVPDLLSDIEAED